MSDARSFGLFEAEAVEALRRAAGSATALVNELEAASNALAMTKCNTEQRRQISNGTEFARAVKMRVEALARRLQEGE